MKDKAIVVFAKFARHDVGENSIMVNSLRSRLAADNFSNVNSEVVTLVLRTEHSSVTINRDGFSIGSHPRCDLRLTGPSIPLWHSVIHIQGGAIWIEAAENNTLLNVNGRQCRRLALRQGDHFHVAQILFTVDLSHLKDECVDTSDPDLRGPLEDAIDDLGILSAEDLCDRIVSEQTMIRELSEEASTGWTALLHALEAVHEDPIRRESVETPTIADVEEQIHFNHLIVQIDQIQETIAEHSKESNNREAIISATSTLLDASQQRATQRLDEMIEHMDTPESLIEFRASA